MSGEYIPKITLPRAAIEAGFRVLEESGRLAEGELSSDWLLPQEVLAAMLPHLSRELLLQLAETSR